MGRNQLLLCCLKHVVMCAVVSGGDHGQHGDRRVSQKPPQRADVSHLSGHAEEHHDHQRVSASLLLRVHRHRAALRVRLQIQCFSPVVSRSLLLSAAILFSRSLLQE